MKKLLLFVLSAFCLGACSVDTIDTETIDSQISAVDITIRENGCEITTFNFSDAGRIEVRNDLEFIYVKIIAHGNYEIAESYLHIASDLMGFPTTKNGGIITNNMEHKLKFSPLVKEYTYKFPIELYGDSFLVGAYTIFQLKNKKFNFWAGEFSGNNWSYFNNTLFDHPNAGADNSKEITLSEAKALPSLDEVRKVYTSMLDAGVPEGFKVGHFNPTIKELVANFNDPDPVLGGVGEYPTVYTIGEGECTDSVILTMIVVPDSM